MQFWEIFGHKLDSSDWQTIQFSKDLFMQDPKKAKMVYSTTSGTVFADGGSVSKIFQTLSLLHYQTHRSCVCRRKVPSLQPKSSYLSKHWML